MSGMKLLTAAGSGRLPDTRKPLSSSFTLGTLP